MSKIIFLSFFKLFSFPLHPGFGKNTKEAKNNLTRSCTKHINQTFGKFKQKKKKRLANFDILALTHAHCIQKVSNVHNLPNKQIFSKETCNQQINVHAELTWSGAQLYHKLSVPCDEKSSENHLSHCENYCGNLSRADPHYVNVTCGVWPHGSSTHGVCFKFNSNFYYFSDVL